VLSTGAYSNTMAWTSDGIYAGSTVRVDPGLTRGPGKRRRAGVDNDDGPRWDHGTVQGLDRLPHARLAYVAVCRPREDQVLILGGARRAGVGRVAGTVGAR